MMKKVLSILVSILFSFSVIAFAQETPTKTPPTATGGADSQIICPLNQDKSISQNP